MLMYKCFFRIVRAHISTFLLYSAIFLIMGGTAAMLAGGQHGEFVRTSVNIGVVNRDNDHQITQALLSYLEGLHTIIPMDYELNALTDEVFFHRIRYALIIEENFGNDFTENNLGALWHINSPQNVAINNLIGRQIDSFLQTIQGYLTAGFGYDQAINLAKQDHEHKVTVLSSEGASFISRYFSSLIFMNFSFVIMVLGVTLIAFKEKDLANRHDVSPMTPRSRTIWLALAGGSFAYGLWILMMIPAFFLHHESLFTMRGALHMLNSFALVTLCACIAVLLAQVTKDVVVIMRIIVVFGLIATFTGSPFAPLDQVHVEVQAIARLTPSYWHAFSSQVLYGSFLGADVNMSDFWMGVSIQLGFAVAIFAISMVIGREKKQAGE